MTEKHTKNGIITKKRPKTLEISKNRCIFAPPQSPDGGIGRRAGLKHQWGNPSRFEPGSGYEFNSKVIAKPLITKGLAIFLFQNFPTFSPHLQEFVQRNPIFPTRKARIRDEC